MKPFCVIPARRDSKRLRLKNLFRLAGVPMVVYTIQAAIDSGIFDEVLVSTEDDEIAEVAAAAGAKVHIRPIELAGDLVSATDVCLEAFSARKARPEDFHGIVCLQPSSPLRTAEDIRNAWDAFLAADSDFLVSVTDIDPHYFHWAVHQNGAHWQMWFGDRFLMERPLLPPVYRPNGAVKIGRPAPLAALRNFFGESLSTYAMPEERSIHVATHFDTIVCEALLSQTTALR